MVKDPAGLHGLNEMSEKLWQGWRNSSNLIRCPYAVKRCSCRPNILERAEESM
jgi:hypothetical protein